VKALATDADAVEVTSNHRSGVTKLSVSVAPDDMGRLIGRRGRTAQALRTLVGVGMSLSISGQINSSASKHPQSGRSMAS
jgi:predicted RNA-binding protein YlqC (UPF0109 family)